MKYDAFISYRHLPRDMFVAKGIHRALETTRLPKKIQELTGKKKIQRVFRDQEELSIGSDLSENIEAALRESEYLIVICTPQTRESIWVMKEIDTFISLRGRDHVLAVLAEGEPLDSFPYQILYDALGNPREPLAADVRGYSKKEITNKIKSESLRLAASILGCDYDDLRQRHKERIVKRNMRIAVAAAALGIAFGAYNAWNLARINENYKQMLVQESKALAERSMDVLDNGDRKTAAKIVMAALPGAGGDRPYVTEAANALSVALGSYDMGDELSYDGILEHDVQVEGFDYDEETGYLVSYTENGDIYFWNVKTGELLFKRKPAFGDETQIIHAVKCIDTKAVVVTAYGLCAYDVEGNEIYSTPFSLDSISSLFFGVAFSQSEERVAISAYDHLLIYDTTTGEAVIGYSRTEEGDFGDQVVFLGNDIVAVSCEDENGREFAEIWLLDEGYMVVNPKHDHLLGMNFSSDGKFWTASMPKEDFDTYTSKTMTVEKFEMDHCEQILEKEYIYDNSQYESLGCLIRSRTYEQDGREYAELLMTAGKSFYLLDLYTGELISRYVPDSEITGMMYTSDSSDVAISSAAGTYTVLNARTGIAYDKNTVTIKAGIRDFCYRDDTLIVRSYKNRNLFLLRRREAQGLVLLDKLDIDRERERANMAVSPDGKKVVVYMRLDSDDVADSCDLYIYDVEKDERIADFTVQEGYGNLAYFLDDDTIVIPCYSGLLSYFSISKNKLEKVEVLKDYYLGETGFSRNGKYMVDAENLSGRLAVVDVADRKVISDVHLDEWDELEDAPASTRVLITGDGESIFYLSMAGKFYKADTREGDVDEYLQDVKVKAFWLSADDKYLFAGCDDGMLRMCNPENGEVLETVEIGMEFDCFVEMSSDDKRLYLQGEDLFVKVYDLSSHEFIYEASSPCKEIRGFTEDLENRRLIFINEDVLFMLDMDTYAIYGQCKNGKAYAHGGDYIIANAKRSVIKFKVKSVDELIRDAQEAYGDCTLSEQEKRKYGVR